VAVVAVALDEPDAEARHVLTALHDEERRRADRFHFAVDRDRFLVGRAALRALLAQQIGRAPDAIAYETAPHGKPALARNLANGLHFNMAHSRGLALIALTRAAEVGVDVEAMSEMPDLLAVATRFFAPAEVAIVRAMAGQERIEAFFTCWTRKEAYIKALGTGLSHPLDRFVVALHPQEPSRLLDTGDDAMPASRWTLTDLRPATGFVGALAIPHHAPVVRCWQW
jgi:4'-phosphopantetheinyl transferase